MSENRKRSNSIGMEKETIILNKDLLNIYQDSISRLKNVF